MRPILFAVLGLSALTVAPLWLAAGCGGNTNQAAHSATGSGGAATSSGHGGAAGHGGATGTAGQGGTGGQGGGCVPTPELCDGIDNNCDGVVDEGCACKNGDTKSCYTGDPATLGMGVCVGGASTCDLNGIWGPCAGEVLPTAELCDGLDNDCNGTTDEGLGSTTCGVGACQRVVQNCVAGVPQTCVPGAPTPEACNGVDDNCDGLIDEGCLCTDGALQSCYTGPPSTLNVGVCKAGTQTCQGGQWLPCQGDVVPTAEVCNAKDDDCDGAVDDGLGSSVCGVGACQAMVQNCVAGLVQTCAPGQPSAEVCDGVDNDCNGLIDDGLGTSSCGVGACVNTVPSCKNGQPNTCTPLPQQVEVCDGVDNDCNGLIDDGNPGGGGACTTGQPGVCAAGTVICVGGGLQCVQNVQAGAEVCDGKDNDCNGMVDDGNPGGGVACNTGKLGVCAAGTTSCQSGTIVCVQNVQPSVEICDGKDNDCDGAVDNGNPGGAQACSTGKPGVCSAGTTACTGGSILCNQNVQPSAEICDGLDNDCDGTVDNGNPGGNQICATGKPGVCAQGTTACTGGAIACNQNVQPGPETCDGLDNNCNGAVDEGNPGSGAACNTGLFGVCAAGTTTCTAGAIKCNQNVQPSPETCDGLDNDCNGVVDNGNPGGGATCSTGLQGVCAAGTTACAAGTVKCNQNQQPSAETCDGLDNNCNGTVDEGCNCLNGATQPCYGGAAGTKNVGVCHGGTQTCVNGTFGACVGQVLPSAETCDGLDNNCNGQVDDGLGTISCGVGQCARTVAACVSGQANTCTPGAPSAEVCDGLDNDCDGVVDNGNPGSNQACNTGHLGVCAAGLTTCQGGAISCIQQHSASPETCNGLDDDCDGVVDNGNPGGNLACGTGKLGVCAAGTTACTAGAIKCNQNVQPSPEVCDGLDNDCNGVVDNGNPGGGASCATGLLGVCSAGTTACAAGAIKCNQNVQPSAEVCDGLDNDCNGVVDNGNPGGGASCATGLLGVCSAGTTACTAGVVKCNQNVQPSPEVCDGLDNDCNGVIDNGNPGGGQACSTGQLGVCAAGTTACSAGAIACNRNVNPSPEVCDGLDNDCNGVVDNGNPGGGASCATGLLGVCSAGTTACAAGAIKCNQNVQPSAEVCDGLDNDCNGVVDNGNPGGGQACSTGLLGVCSAGTTACTAGAVHCNQNVQPSPEVCDGLDNDCNGVADNGNPGGGVACSTGQLGVCAAGTTACSVGAIACNRNVNPSAEICDGLDNDCNGVVDNGNPGGGVACSTGQPGVCGPGTTACSGGAVACNRNVNPSAEICDGLDNDCNGVVDNGNPGGGVACSTGLLGVCAPGTTACTAGTVKCNQNVTASAETCDGLDNNCNGQVDEGVKTTYYRDADGDGYGNPNLSIQACSPPAGYVSGNTDCNDGNASVHPGATELCNGIDDNCNGQIDEGCPVTYAANVRPILAAHCAPCHTTGGSGGANLASVYSDTQLMSYACPGKTKGACALVRIQNGSMPQGAGCTGNPAMDTGNAACLTASEQATIQAWITGGQLP